ncbi:MAG: helix-turn-helix domain-containing protein [bacterium]
MRKSLHRPEHAALAALIRKTRLRRGLTQVQVCRTLRAPQSFLSDVETGQRRLDLVQLHDLCKALGIPLARLVATFEKRIART